MSVDILLGNEAIGLGLVEAGCRVVTAYPGTPSSEILAGVIKHKKRLNRDVYTEWSTNEKVAFEVALAASWTGLRAAVTMKQVGLNVAADPLFSAAYTGVKGGFLVIPADDPGPHSSQTEQDSRLMAMNAKVPVFDPSTPEEAREMVPQALALSEEYGTPVILRPTTRLCHALQSLELDETLPHLPIPKVRFRKDPPRWTATPKFRYLLHKELNQKISDIEGDFSHSPLNYVVDNGASREVGLIASGVAFQTVLQALEQMDLSLPVLKLGTPYPLPRRLVNEFMMKVKTVVVIEEPDVCIELQVSTGSTHRLSERADVRGRLDGTVPAAGELTPDEVYHVLQRVLAGFDGLNSAGAGFQAPASPADPELQRRIQSLPLPVRRPRLCPGCGHRSAFYTMKRSFGPRAIYPGDIGCYTLGTNLRAVDTFVDMGAAVTMATGFYQANRIVGDKRPIIASIGDSTFLHSGVVPLINAVHTGARFVLVILDNHTTAMTGFQPTASSDYLADGSDASRKVSIPELVRACGVEYVVETDPYDQESFGQVLTEAHQHTQSPEGGVAVVIANRPCVLYDPTPLQEHPVPVVVTEECDGCRFCVEAFECPALVLAPDKSRVDVNYKICVECGQCIDACYKGFIVPKMPVGYET